MLGPFAIDTYLPAFTGITASLNATPLQMQQTLSAYLAGFAFMNLFHGALADSFGRRPVVLSGVALFTVASIGCAMATSIEALVAFRGLQGISTGAGIVVSRAVVRDLFPPSEAQKMMAQITLFFGVAPAIAPIIGGVLFVYLNWHAVFWALALIGVALFAINYKFLPESLNAADRQPFNVRNLFRGYREVSGSGKFWLLALASGVPFNGMFLYVLSAPAFLGEHLLLKPTEFFWFFCCVIGGIMGGAALSGRLAGKVQPKRQIRTGFVIMLAASAVNLLYNFSFTPSFPMALFPIAAFAFGWSLMMPVVTLLVLDMFPARRGLVSSLQAVVASAANAVVAGVLAPLVMHNPRSLALASVALMSVGLLAWLWVKRSVARVELQALG